VIVELAAAFVFGAACVGVFTYFRGCTGGHDYPDEPTWVNYHVNGNESHDMVVPFKIGVHVCRHEGCLSQQTEEVQLTKEILRDEFESAVKSIEMRAKTNDD
jgi:hypothetical protein